MTDSVDLAKYGDVQRAKTLLLAIANCKPEGWQRVVLFKVFWKAHLRHMLQHGRALSNWPIVKMPLGHGIEHGEELLEELARDGALRLSIEAAGDHEAKMTRPGNPDLVERALTELGVEERESIKWACDEMRSVSSSEATRVSHDARSWQNATTFGDRVPIYTDLMEDDRVERAKAAFTEFAKLLPE